jgi:hypothetical protein
MARRLWQVSHKLHKRGVCFLSPLRLYQSETCCLFDPQALCCDAPEFCFCLCRFCKYCMRIHDAVHAEDPEYASEQETACAKTTA